MAKKSKIMIVDDDKDILNLLKMSLSKRGLDVITESSPLTALEKISSEKIDVVILDKTMPEIDGLEILKHIKAFDESIQVIIMTGFGSIETAVEAIKLGAFHYITKPVNVDELEFLIKQALEHKTLKEENKRLKDLLSPKIITENPVMREIVSKAQKVSQFDTNILITGESGTGKEVLAKFIAQNSKRSDKPFIAINCGAIPGDLLESELFGYKKGAFTGANYDKKGLVAEAEGGTLFLDEIGELPLNLQVKLLRLIQEKEYIPLGETKPKKANVRFIFATNKDLQKLIREGSFREDLYYRINTIHFHLPPLRERKEDIIPLAKFFLRKFALKYEIPEKILSQTATSQLLDYHWPGNVRELEATIERTVLMEEAPVINFIHFENQDVSKRYEIPKPVNIKKYKEAKEEFDRNYYQNLLRITNWNITKAAKLSGKTRAEIYRAVKRLNLQKNLA